MARAEMLGNRARQMAVRLSEAQDAELRARADAAGMSISDYVREQLRLSFKESNNVEGRVEDHERRISRLEGVAGLD